MKTGIQTFGFSPLKKYADAEIDPYSTAIVDDLLSSQAEWRSLNDIVRLTLKALTDVVRSQGESIKELEKQLPTRASKTELHTGLSLKSNISDISRTVSEIAASLDQRITQEDINTLLKDYILKSDLQYLLSNKVSVDEVRNLLDRGGSSETKTEIEIMKTRIEEFQKEVVKKIGSLPTLKELSSITQNLEMKANLQDVNEALETKASKQSVQNALAKKLNKQDLETALQNYASLQDMQPLIQSLDQKASLEQIEKIAQILEVKVDRSDFTILINSVQNKAEINEIDLIRDSIQEQKLQMEQRHSEQLQKQDQLKVDLEEIKVSVQQAFSKKAEQKEIEKLQNQISKKKSELDILQQQQNSMRQEIYQDMNRLRDEILQQKQFTSEQLQSTILKSSHVSEKLTEELYNLSEQVRQIDEEWRADCEDIRKIVQRIANIKKEQTTKMEEVYEELDNIKQSIEENQNKFAQKKDLSDLKAKIIAQIEDRPAIQEVQKVLHNQQTELANRWVSFKDEIRSELKGIQNEINHNIIKKAANSELANKTDVQENLIKAKVSYQDFEELKKIVHKLCIDQDERITQREFSQHIQFTKGVLDLIQKDMLLKANIKDVCTLIDSKANIEDVNVALTSIHKELDQKPNYEDLNNIVQKQAAINDSLCEENIVARFQWRSGELKSGQTIPWEYQNINTLPDNYIWEKDKSSILIVAPGVYQVIF